METTLLAKLKALDKEINTVIIGVGAMGKGLFYQCEITPNVKCLAIADLNINKCVEAANMMGVPYMVVENKTELEKAINNKILAICVDGELLSKCDYTDVVVEATNAIVQGAKFVIGAIENGKHVVLMNAEIDLLYGPYFMELAKTNNVICTSIDGDQYGVTKRIIDDLQLWGFDLVMAGNIKGYLDRYSDPIKIKPEADKRNLDYKMCTSYTDGTKLCIEMAIIANAFGMKTLVPGMHGPRAGHVSEVFDLYDFETLYKNKQPFVDYILGSEPGGGVFAVGFNDHPYQMEMMEYYKMGNGPFYLFYRPYHLCHVEAMASIVETVLFNKALLQPTLGFQTNVYAYAKTDLKKGETLDGLGGHTCYGLIENCDKNTDIQLPVLLAEDVTLKRDIAKDTKIYMEDINFDKKSYGFSLYYKALSI